MNTFHCTRCRFVVFFENVVCSNCGAALGFVPEEMGMVAFDAGGGADGRWRRLDGDAGEAWKPCRNYVGRQLCNWMVAATDPDPLCRCCRHTEATQPVGDPSCAPWLFRLEGAKRRLFHALYRLGLPLGGGDAAREPRFRFLTRGQGTGSSVTTGYADGVVTMDIMEADDACREARRVDLGEPYRTLLGHFRHEIGHYYWDRLLARGPKLEAFRALFGDERRSYAEAMSDYYDSPPPPDWADRCISVYATMHPWEDWAESFAHYLHISDGLDTAAHWGFSLQPDDGADRPAQCRVSGQAGRPFREVLVEQWLPLSQFLNAMGRSLGNGDAYPFVIPPAVLDKLCFVHDFVAEARPAEGRQEGGR